MSSAQERLESLWSDSPGLRGFFGTVDHKKIGRRYIVTAIAFLVAGGILASLIRLQLAGPERGVLGPETYNQVFTMHGVVMIFWYASPILSGLIVYSGPLMMGARDMAYPRLNAFTYWTFLASGLFLFASFFIGQAPDAGWFAYVPMANKRYSPGLGMDFYALALIFLTISTTGGAINFIATILRHRAPGMSIGKMPLALWSTLTVSVVILFALPPLTVACTALELDRQYGFRFFDPSHGGDPILWQHLFWFFGHPWVYVIFLPATGMISMILPTFARRPIVGYRWVAASTVLTGVIGFLVWVHHMFASGGAGHGAMSFFSTASMVISLFTTIQVFAWIATLVQGRPVFTTSMMFALGFIASIVMGGLTGVITAVVPLDWQVTDTYFVVAHLHYVLIGANVFPVFAALYYWWPKLTGRIPDERLGKISFWLMFAGFQLVFFPMHITGLLGMPRRIYTFGADRPWTTLNLVSSLGLIVLTAGIAISVINALTSKKRAGKDPWLAPSLEWDTESPPPPYGSVHLPKVETKYPLWDEFDETYDPTGERILDQGRLTFTTHWKTGEPIGVAKMPEETLLPLWLSIVMTGGFAALLLRSLAIAGGAALVSLLLVAAWLWPKRERRIDVAAIGDEIVPEALDAGRGRFGMWCLVATEAMLFVALFFAHFYLNAQHPPREPAPELKFALVMLAILVTSSVVLHWGERQELAHPARARVAIAITALLGLAFFGVQIIEYREHLRLLLPQDDGYASVFYTITSFHALHVLVGIAMLGFVLFVPRLTSDRPPHRSLHTVSLYWHFVDVVWVVIVATLYVLPHL
jgi:cytochrome c oxidase subunit I+III